MFQFHFKKFFFFLLFIKYNNKIKKVINGINKKYQILITLYI